MPRSTCRGNVQLAAVFQNLPGTPIQAQYVAGNAEVAPTLGRNLGRCGIMSTVCNGTVLVDLLEPNTVFDERLTQVDFRLTRQFTVGEVRIRPQFDIYNMFNSNAVLLANNRYGGSWQRANLIHSPRLFKFGAQLDF